jgi:hypothetical protein
MWIVVGISRKLTKRAEWTKHVDPLKSLTLGCGALRVVAPSVAPIDVAA